MSFIFIGTSPYNSQLLFSWHFGVTFRSNLIFFLAYLVMSLVPFYLGFIFFVHSVSAHVVFVCFRVLFIRLIYISYIRRLLFALLLTCGEFVHFRLNPQSVRLILSIGFVRYSAVVYHLVHYTSHAFYFLDSRELFFK